MNTSLYVLYVQEKYIKAILPLIKKELSINLIAIQMCIFVSGVFCEIENTLFRLFRREFSLFSGISLDNGANIYLSDSKWESTKVLRVNYTETFNTPICSMQFQTIFWYSLAMSGEFYVTCPTNRKLLQTAHFTRYVPRCPCSFKKIINCVPS